MSLAQSRPIALTLVVGAHVLLIFVLERVFHVSRPGATTVDDDTITVNFIKEPTNTSRPPVDLGRGKQPLRVREKRAYLSPPEAPTPIPQTVDAHIDAAIIDWESEARAVADDALERERQRSAKRSFAHTSLDPKPTESPGVFGSEQENHRAGLVEDGERFWVTDNCYFDIPRRPPPPRLAGEFHLLTRTCKPDPTGGGTSMFDDMKPDYLKEPPTPSPSQK
jgi:hypothetical protein